MHTWIEDAAPLAAWMNAHAAATTVALDTEFMRTNTFRARLALVQINLDDDIAVLDAPRLGDLAPLSARLRDPACVSVMHAASEDLEALLPILPQGPALLFDTQIAAAMVGLGFGLSYQKLVFMLLGVDLPKAETRSDWLQRPLTAAQLDYAAQDVAHLRLIHVLLSEKLAALGRSDWHAEDCRRLVERVCNAQPDAQPQRAFRGAAGWSRDSQALLRRVLLWRDATARALDKPRPWILDDAHVLGLVAQPPADAEELFERCKGQRALRGEQRRELLDVLHMPLHADDLHITPISAAPTSAQKRQLATLRDVVAAIAQRLELPEGLLCPRRHLETLVYDGVWPQGLDGWRKPLLHDALTARPQAEIGTTPTE
jgi:ribonuclease D